jgi:MraZ protein
MMPRRSFLRSAFLGAAGLAAMPVVLAPARRPSLWIADSDALAVQLLDSKRRVRIPAKWRSMKPGTELTLILWRKSKEGPCLRVLPPQRMAKLMRDLDAMPNSDPNKVVLQRFIGSRSTQVILDPAGRISLPDEMARAAGISKEAVLVGLVERFEIWSPARYDLYENRKP